MSNFPSDRRYTKEHEWAKLEGDSTVVGVSAFAVEQLGDITMVTIDTAIGDQVEAGKPLGTIESVKTLSDLNAPISGTLEAINDALEESPELVNDDCYDKGWIAKVKPSAKEELEKLLDVAAYEQHVKSSAH